MIETIQNLLKTSKEDDNNSNIKVKTGSFRCDACTKLYKSEITIKRYKYKGKKIKHITHFIYMG